ncbi:MULTISPECIES: LysR family transcriptional regulator [Myxococcus]|uniref:LysR family transcriptional regulator n=1 Tax=Myxococcus llanfairpwllgwyngyllgogerychwyrndrobwllllantysiliogogogochensis TaxID=2590453 RepID=A0A540X753_9BACT|nr:MULTISPECIES: LysR family transcriptional regulator [Myxococcus]NTX01749.1 LysR family transcriptional regulator [Myxococcus sp. CA040A]TQF17097.1 LysR family transcriptional regulator [Myxococcus llanfairpwllgwyngyllgogerychwyrndrobwllllantysiliogogogochensis]
MSKSHVARGKSRVPTRRKPRVAPAPSQPSNTGLDLSGVNLNLVVALDALLTEGNVTRAATRVGITQSAMSHALRQLREQFGDALLIRGRGGMIRTPRAEQLAAPLHRGLLEVQRALRNESVFEARTSARRFTIASGDYFAAALLPPLLEMFDDEAPRVDLTIRPLVVSQVEAQLESGEVDLVIGAYPDPAPALRQQKLFTEDFVCVVRRDNSLVKEELDLETYLRLPHVLVSPRGEGAGAVDVALERLGRSRRIGLRIPYFLTAAISMVRSNHVLTAPRRLAELFLDLCPLRILPPPVSLRPFDVLQVWHERFDDEPAHRWLRGMVSRAAAAPRDER